MFLIVVLQEFIIHTPSEDAQKMYIGNAIKGNYAAVFAQLIINGESQGETVHAHLHPVWNIMFRHSSTLISTLQSSASDFGARFVISKHKNA